MSVPQGSTTYLDEVVDLLVALPSREQLLSYRPSEHVQHRASELLRKLKNGDITPEEDRELDQFEHVEMLMCLIKAKLRTTQPDVDPQ